MKLSSLFWGLLLYSLGILLTIHAGLGVSPWDAFHLGLVNKLGLTLGQISQIVGFTIIAICVLLKEYPGWGTIANTYFIGLFIDIIEKQKVIPYTDALFWQIIMIITGVLLIGWATFFYLGAALGSGPRDGLMLALARKFSSKVWKVRTLMEIGVVLVGYFLGGPIGIGTIFLALSIGPSIQFAYRIAGREPKNIKHRILWDDYQMIKQLYCNEGKVKTKENTDYKQ